MSDFIMGARLELTDDFSTTMSAATTATQQFRNSLGNVDDISSAAATGIDQVTQSINPMLDAMEEVASASEGIQEAADAVQDMVQPTAEAAANMNRWQAAMSSFDNGVATIRQLPSTLKQIATTKLDGLKNSFTGAKTKASELVTSVKTLASTKISSLVSSFNTFRSTVSEGRTGISGLTTSLKNRSMLVNMTLLRKTAAEKAMTGAILRVIRALIGMKGAYTMEELRKPFAVARVTFSPDYSDPAVRNAMLSQGMNAVGNMFGSRPPLAMGAADATPSVSADTFSPEEFADNPAFATDTPPTIGEDYATPQPEYSAPPQGETNFPGDEGDGDEEPLACSQCGREISQKIYDFSKRRFGVALCMKCQKEVE